MVVIMEREENFISTEGIKTADSFKDTMQMILDGSVVAITSSTSDPTLMESDAFQKMHSKIKVAMETMRVGAGAVSSAVSELPDTVKKATIHFCAAMKSGAEHIWKAIQAGSSSLSKTIEEAWGSILSKLGKVFSTMAPLVDQGNDVLEKAATELEKKARELGGAKKHTRVAGFSERLVKSRSIRRSKGV